jgi:EmrB/QacA subfamily drug resistance transporter
VQYVQTNQTGFSFTRKQTILIMVGLMLTLFLASLDQTIVGTAEPRIIGDLGGFALYTWIATAYMIASTVILPIAGKLTDIRGPKFSYIIGISLFIAGSVLCGFSQSMIQIIIFRGLQGLGAGVITANAFAVIADLFPPEKRAKYTGMVASVFGISSIIGPTIGGYLTDSLSWHWVFFVNIPLAIAVLIMFIFYFPSFRHSVNQKMDYAGLAALLTTIVPLLLALSWGGNQHPWNSLPVVGLFAMSFVSLVIFFLIERKAPQPIIPLVIFKDRNISLAFIITFLTGIAMFGTIIFLPLYYQGVLGSSAAGSGNCLMPMMFSMVGSAVIAGMLLAKNGGLVKILGIAALSILAVGIYLLSTMNSGTTYLTSIIYIVIAGFGLGITMPLYMLMIQNSVPREIMGSTSSLIGFARSIGGTIGLAIFGSLMTSRFTSEFAGNIPATVKDAIPADMLSSTGHNAQALVNPQMQMQMKETLGQMGSQGLTIYEQMFHTIRESLSSSISEIFLVAMGIAVLALMVQFFIKTKPARQTAENPVKAGPMSYAMSELQPQEIKVNK